MPVKKAILPVAGLGTRFFPVTKSNPKEMLPVVDIPLIQYAVNEAISAGITELIFITNKTKRSIQDYFDQNLELETYIEKSRDPKLLETIRNILPKGISCTYIDQESPRGLGHAVLCAKEYIGEEPFAVLLADDLIDAGETSCLKQMIEAFEHTSSSLLAIQKIPRSETQKYGIVEVPREAAALSPILSIVEKPSPMEAPSNLAVVGRYILSPGLFKWLEHTPEGLAGEIQLTDAIAQLLSEEKVYAFEFQGRRYDCGNQLGYLEAIMAFALKHPTLGQDVKHLMQKALGFSQNILEEATC